MLVNVNTGNQRESTCSDDSTTESQLFAYTYGPCVCLNANVACLGLIQYILSSINSVVLYKMVPMIGLNDSCESPANMGFKVQG